jgi:transposase
VLAVAACRQRATSLLGYHAGESIASISRRIGMTRLSVTKWVAKALAVGPMAALKDNYHRPKNPVIGDDAKACHRPLKRRYGSWLNIVETLFGKMARSFLRHIRVQSLDELKTGILKGIAEINAAPVVHRWQNFDALKPD